MFQLRLPRYLRTLIILGCVFCGYYLVFYQSENEKLDKIYDSQMIVSEILQQKMKYMAEIIFPDKDEWVPTAGIDGHIFSAYLELRPDVIVDNSLSTSDMPWSQVRILAIIPLDIINTQRVDCMFKLTTKERTIYQRKSAKVKALGDHWNLKYAAAFVLCDLIYPEDLKHELLFIAKELPESVGILLKSFGNMSAIQFIDIHYPRNGFNQLQNTKKTMAVCVPVLHHNFSRALELIEFMEYYRMMGINHFTFYKASASQEVSQILEFYKSNSIATVLPWHLSSTYIYEQTLRLEGLFAALNDCLYRNGFYNDYKYVGVFDVDEFLVPKHHNNFTQLLRYLDPSSVSAQEDGKYASYLFRHVYFYTMYPDAEKIDLKMEPYLHTKQKTQRLKKPHPAHIRSRYIINAQDVIEMGHNQFVEIRKGSLHNSAKPFHEMIVDPTIALLHHYAPCEAEETGCYLKSIEIDNTAQKFTKKLSEMVDKVCSLVFGAKKCPPPIKRKPGEI